MTFQKTQIAAGIAMALVSMASVAQQAEEAKVTTVTVTGIRNALRNAVSIKRNANSVVDAVSAEDIGKLPDTDVGESLGRIPGVSVGRAFGQGASVSVRGSDPQMTYTTLNGQTVASTGWYDQQSLDRSFNYSLLPSELIGGMEVYKSSQADLTEGGIGGTVIVKTRKPLDMPSGTAFIGAKLGKGSISTDLSKDISGLVSWKNDESTFGVLVAGATERGDYIRRGVEANYTWNGDVSPTTFVQERKRTALNLSMQAKPNKSLNLGVNFTTLQLEADNSNTSHYIFQGNNCSRKNAADVCTLSDITAATSVFPFVQTWARKGKMTSDSLTLNATYKADGVKLEAVAGTTKADGGTSLTTNYGYSSDSVGFNPPKWDGRIDATGNQIKVIPRSNQSTTLANLPANSSPETWASSRGPNSDKENYGQMDLTLNLDWGAISSFKTGVRKSSHTFEKRTDRATFGTPTAVPTASLYSGSLDLMDGWSTPRPNIGAMTSNTLRNITGWIEERPGFGSIKEENTALYGMFNLEKDALHGNIGVRYIGSSVKSIGYKLDGTALAAGDAAANAGWGRTRVEEKASYHDFLPSLNLAYDLNKEVVIRGTASQAITRPNYDNMFLASQAGFQDNIPGNETVTFGNPALKPMKSTQFDLGLEYYYGKGNMISLMVFHKKIKNFITTETLVNQKIGVISPDSHLDSWTVNRYVNAGGGKIDGIEAQLNHGFDNGFGVLANYTLSNASAPAISYTDRLDVFTQSSKHNMNLVGYWENQTYSSRLAYNWRSKYMIRETGYYGNRMHDAYGTLDASFGWNITPRYRLQFEVTNLLRADDIQYGVAGTNTTVKDSLKVGYPAWSFAGERTWKISFNAKF